MNISCLNDFVGNIFIYWFNFVGGISVLGNGIVDNMFFGSDVVNNVGIIFKFLGSFVVFYDIDNYNYKINISNDFNKIINLIVDYYC